MSTLLYHSVIVQSEILKADEEVERERERERERGRERERER